MKNITNLKNQLRFLSTGLLVLNFLILVSSADAQIRSAGSGEWYVAATWEGGVIPGDNDEVVIVSTHTVDLTGDVAENLLSITIQANAILDLNEFQIANVQSFLNDGASATLRTRQHFIEATNDNSFYANDLSIVEIDGSVAGDFIVDSRTEFPNLTITKREAVALNVFLDNLDEITINGDLNISLAQSVIDNNDFQPVTLHIGNPVNDHDCTVRVAGDINVSNAFLMVEDDDTNLDQHLLDVAGNISLTSTTDTELVFDRANAAHYTSDPNNSIVNLQISGAENATFSMDGASATLNRLIVNKEIDAKVTLSADDETRFSLFGKNNQGDYIDRALYIQQGILELGDNMQIPSLIESNIIGASFTVREDAGLILNGNNSSIRFSTEGGASDYLIVIGTLKVIKGTFDVNANSLILFGKLEVSHDADNIGTVDIETSLEYTTDLIDVVADPSIVVDGGILNVGYQMRRERITAPENAELDLTVINNGVINIYGNFRHPWYGMFEVYGAGSSLTLGEEGAINIYRSVNRANITDVYIDPEVFVAPEASNFEILLTAEEPGITDNFTINSTVALSNLTLSASNGAEASLTLENDLHVKKSLNIINDNSNGATLHENNHNIEIEGNLSIVGGTFEPLTNTVTFSGNYTSSITNNGGTLSFHNLTINRNLGAGVVSLETDITVNGDMSFSAGSVAIDEGLSIELKNNLNGEASFTPTGTLLFSNEEGEQQFIGSGILPSVEVESAGGVAASGNVIINGDLSFLFFNGGLDIQSNLLTLGENSTINDEPGDSRINTSGLVGMGGMRKLFPAGPYTDTYTFPLLSNDNEASVTIHIAGAELEEGAYITVKPIDGVTPLTTNDVESTELAIYWDIKQNGFDLGAASVSHELQYAAAHEQEADLGEYIPALFTEEAWFTPAEDDLNEFVYVDEVSRVITFDALGDGFENHVGFQMSDPKIAGVFTAGKREEFGPVRKFISKKNGGWNEAGVWSIDTDGDGFENRENNENEVPEAGDIVIITGEDADNLHDITSTSDDLRAYSLQVEGTLKLGAETGGTKGHRFTNITGLGTITTYPFDDNGMRYYFDQNFNNIDQFFGKLGFAGLDDAELPNNLTKVNSLEITGGGNKILTTNLEVVESLILTDGNVVSSEGSKLTISDITNLETDINLDNLEGMASGARIESQSYVVGPMIIKGDFSPAGRIEFPIGSEEGNYRPIGLDFQVADGGEYMLEAELIEGDANFEGVVYPGDLEAVSSLRYWKVTAVGPVSESDDFQNITASLSYDAAVDGINSVAAIANEVKLTKAPQLGQPYTDVWDLEVQGNVLSNSGVDNQFDGFSILVFGTTNFESNPLPVTLVSFEGKAQNDGVTLNWVTASEVNNSHFEVERSLDGESFDQIGIVDGFGTTTVTQNYSFIDSNSASGVVYYRLRQVDFDGAFEYSKIITVIVNQATDSPIEEFVVYPNPIQSGTFSIAKVGSNDAYASYNVTLQDVSGKVYYSKENTLDSASNELATMVNKLGSGVYLLRISSGDDQQVVRLLK